MRKITMKRKTNVTVNGAIAYFIKTVTKFGTGAKIDCPKEYIGKTVHIIVHDED